MRRRLRQPDGGQRQRRVCRLRPSAEVEGLVLLAEHLQATVRADQSAGVGVGLVIEIGRRCAAEGANEEIGRPWVPWASSQTF